MKAENWPQLVGELTDHMANVRRVFNELIGDDEADTPQEEERSEPWREVWQDALQEDDSTPVLAHLADEDRRQVLTLIADFRKELDKRPIGPRGRQVLDQLMPHLLADVCSRRRRRCYAIADNAVAGGDCHSHHLSGAAERISRRAETPDYALRRFANDSEPTGALSVVA